METSLRSRFLGAVSVSLTLGLFSCTQPLEGVEVDAPSDKVIGGRSESAYPAVGFLVYGHGRHARRLPECGASFIGPRVAVTAAHCIAFGGEATKFGVGRGRVADGDVVYAERVVAHPAYSPTAPARYRHDVAVLLLARAIPGPFLSIGSVRQGQTVRYVGYGRTEAGSYDVEGRTGERRSTAQIVTASDKMNIWVSGVDGGLCWGDSGGGLVSEDGTTLYGVLADFAGEFDCEEGNSMIFTDLSGEQVFLDWARSVTKESAACEFTCKDFGFAENECRDGWHCDGTCVTRSGC